MKVLIVEDNKVLSNNIRDYLKLEDITSKQLFEWKSVAHELVSENYDIVILDIWLPDMTGIEVCQSLRNSGNITPILMLTARSETSDKIAGLKSGADDYLTKPFDYEELIVRLHTLIRRNQSVKSEFISLKDLEIHCDTKTVKQNGKKIVLSATEFDLLCYLSKNKGKIISKEELLEKVWGEYDAFSASRTLDVYVWYLRKKLGKDIIETKRWLGYIINS